MHHQCHSKRFTLSLLSVPLQFIIQGRYSLHTSVLFSRITTVSSSIFSWIPAFIGTTSFAPTLRAAPLLVTASQNKTAAVAQTQVMFSKKREKIFSLRDQQMCDLAVICHSDIGFARGHPYQLFRFDDELAVFRNIDAAGTVGT